MEEQKIEVPKTVYLKFTTLVKNSITNKYSKGEYIHNLSLYPIMSIGTVIIKNDSSPKEVTKIIFDNGHSIYVKEHPQDLQKILSLSVFDVN